MTDHYTSYQNPPLGVPDFDVLDTYIQSNLLNSSSPALGNTNRILLANSTTLARYSVVAIASGKLVLAVQGTHTPIGVLAHAAVSGSSNTTIFGEVHLTGDFNTDADSPLVWDSSWDTEAKKIAATQGNALLMFRSRTASGSSQP